MLMRKYKKVHNFFSTNKKEFENGETITHKIRFIDIFRSMSNS